MAALAALARVAVWVSAATVAVEGATPFVHSWDKVSDLMAMHGSYNAGDVAEVEVSPGKLRQ